MKLSDSKLINNTLTKLLKDQEIGEKDLDAARVLLTAMVIGPDKAKVKRFANCKDFEKYWENLEKPGVFKDGQVHINIEKGDIEFLMMVNVAEGLMQTSLAPSSEAKETKGSET